MPISNYTSIDLTNITAISGPNFTNCADIGSAPLTPNFSGSVNNPAFNVVNPLSIQAKGDGVWTADINHSTPTTRVDPNARIRRVHMRMQFVGNPNTADLNATSVGAGVLTSTTIVQIQLQAAPEPINAQWITSFTLIDLIDNNVLVGNGAVSSSLSPVGTLFSLTYDFTLNPNGDFPLGYMTYAQFLTNFSEISILLNTLSSIQSSGGAGAGVGNITGSYSGGCALQAANWAMEVEWALPTEWVLETPSITLPDNEIVLTSPGGQPVEEIHIGDTVIEPNDPWVIVWTDEEIRIHLPTDERYDDPDIELLFVGTEFSGASAFLPLTITYADLSGIYQLDDSIHHDVLYNRTATPSTQNVLIPAPFFVTHFVGTPEADVSHYAGTRMGISGQGTVKQVLQSVDYIHTLQFGNNILRTSNNRSPFSLANFVDQHASVRIYMDQLDDFMRVDQLIIFIKPVFTDYPR
jgi:hypothetical protein